MIRLLTMAICLLLPAVAAAAQTSSGNAAVTFSITINSPPSTAITLAAAPNSNCTASGTTLTCSGALAANAEIATISVAPSGWSGGLALSTYTGSAASGTFVIGGSTPNYTLNVGSSGLPVGFTGGASITATP